MGQVTLDGNLFDWKHGSYEVTHPRLSESKATVGGGHSRTGSGVWKRTIKITLLCDNNGVTGAAKTIRNNIRASFAKNSSVSLTAMDGDVYVMYFHANLTERLRFDIDTTGNGFEYEVDIILIEA